MNKIKAINKLTLAFTDKSDEKKYNIFLNEKLKTNHKIILIISSLLFLILPLKHLSMFPQANLNCLSMLIFIETSLIAETIYLFVKPRKYEHINTILTVTAAAALLGISAALLINRQINNNYFYIGILAVMSMWASVFLGLKFKNSLFVILIFIIFYQILGIFEAIKYSEQNILNSDIIVLPAAILSQITAYFLENERRNNYLQSGKINDQNIELSEISLELSDNENALKKIVDDIPVLIISVNQKGQITFWNKSCHEATDFDENEAVKDSGFIEKIFPEPGYRKKVLKHLTDIKKISANFETRISTKSGNKIIVSWKKIKGYKYLSESPNWFAGINITDNYETWKALQKSEQRLKEAQVHAHIGSWEWNLQSDKISWSEEMYRMFGVEPENENPDIHSIFKNSLSATDYKKYIALQRKAVDEKKPVSIEYTILDKYGKEKIMKLEADIVLDRNGEVSHIFGTNLDITDIKQAEIKLSQIKRSLEKAQKIAKIGNWEYNFASKEIFASEEFFEIFGFNKDTNLILPDPVEKLIDIRDKEKFEHFFETALIEGTNCETEFRIRNIKNEKKIISSLAEIEKVNNKIVSVNIIFQDVTLFKKILNQVTKNEQKFRNILQSSPDAIIVLDRDGNITDFNLAAPEIFNYNKEEFYTIRLPELFGDEEFIRFGNQISLLIESSISFRNINFTMRKNKSENIPVEISAGIVGNTKEQDSVSIVAIIKDITERSRYEKELKHARTRAEDADKLKSSFLANMSHEIRTPMNAIVGFSNLLSEPDLTNDERNEYLNYITLNSATLLTLIDDIIDISKIEAGQIKIKKTNVKINELIDDIYATTLEQRKLFEKEHIKLITETDPQIQNSTILLDYVRIRQIFINLINNALKFTNEGYVKFGARITEYFHVKVLNFFVEDTGIGIKEKDINLIFNQFVKIEPENEVLKSGTGLGLTISKKLVTLMGGKITVSSTFGKGSIFNFTIPLQQIKPEKQQNNVTPEKNEEEQWSNIKILIAEDEFTNYKFLETVLKRKNPIIFRAADGLEAVNTIKNNPEINIVLMDIRMPEMDGYEATKKIKEINPKITIIAQTAFAMNTERNKIIAAGFDDYIAKPVEKNKLINIISKYI